MRRQDIFLLVLAPLVVLFVAAALPLARALYERPLFLWVSLIASVLTAGFFLTAPWRASTPLQRRLLCFGLAALLTASQLFRIYRDFGSPSWWVPSPSLLAAFREMTHVVEYAALALVAYRCLRRSMGGAFVYVAALAYAVTTAVADETLQWLHALRVGDMRDVVLDGVSGVIGLFYRAGMAPSPPVVISRVGRWTTAALFLMAPVGSVEFYLHTQTGHRVCDERANCFSSRFSADELAQAARQRREAWKETPFGALADDTGRRRLWVTEDHFLTEARAHFRLGNQAAAVGDWPTACGELSLLEQYYAPSLPVMGVKRADYPCPPASQRFHSRAFGHLVTAAHPARWRAAGAAVGLLLCAWLFACGLRA